MANVGFVLSETEWATGILEIDSVDVSAEGITPEDLVTSATHLGWTKEQNEEDEYVLCFDVDGTVSITLSGIGTAEAEPFIGGRPPITRPHWS